MGILGSWFGTPHTEEGLRMYDHLAPHEAIYQAWHVTGPAEGWHRSAQGQVAKHMPLLARALTRYTLTAEAAWAKAKLLKQKPVMDALAPLMEKSLASTAPRTEEFQALINAWVDLRDSR